MRKKILIIEDDPEIRLNVEAILRLNDYEVISASNGSTGLQLAIRHVPDLIVSDIIMPEMDGLELISELKKLPETFNIPFLFLTARTATDEIRAGMNLGADDYLTKPFKLNDFITAVNMRLKKHEITSTIYNKKIQDLRTSIALSLPHEIKKPIDNILNLTDSLFLSIETSPTAQSKALLMNIKKSAQLLDNIFTKHIKYSNLELLASSKAEIALLREHTCPNVASLISSIARKKAKEFSRTENVEMKIEDATLSISSEHLTSILEEIIDNAFRYSEEGNEVSIKTFKKNNYYKIKVTNQGLGMTTEQITAVAPYIRFNNRFNEIPGAGLGLTIARKITELHGGTLMLDSEEGYYLEVTIELPL